jgi:TonB-dependent SusC/RagA subfamily outer membrane receptor
LNRGKRTYIFRYDQENPIIVINGSGNEGLLDSLKKKNTGVIVTEGKETPLYVIDGEVILPKNKESNLASIRNLDPKDIASISVLKGKNATDKYGENGKEGVVEITTKKGNKDKNNSLSLTIKSDEADKSSNNVTLNLQGKSDNVTLNIHDNAVMKSPLVVVDGKEMEGKEGKEFLKNMDANEIESVSVLKEASATTIYGEKGKNGVVIITTKKGASNFRKEEKEKTTNADKIEVRVFPNPSRSEVTIRFATDSNEPIWIEAYSMEGKKVATILDGAKLNKGQNDINWDTKALPTGAYLIRIKQGATFSQHKVILD